MKASLNGVFAKCRTYAYKCKDIVDWAVDMVAEMKNCPPNSMSVIWMILCVRICFGATYAQTSWMEYLLWGVIGVLTLYRVLKNRELFPRKAKNIVLHFSALIGWMLIGCLFNISFHALKTTAIVLCICCVIVELAYGRNNVQICYFRVFYYLTVVTLFIYTISAVNLGNTIPGCIVFLTCGYIIAEIIHSDSEKFALTLPKTRKAWGITFSIILAFFISWESRARTASFVLLIIVFAFLAFTRINKKYFPHLFWVCIAGTILFSVLYSFIKYLPFYDELNQISDRIFQKNLDSSRPRLWRESLAELSWWQYFIGKGTGVLPSIEKYDGSSFHNSYLQMVMQNGILGLICLYSIFKFFWMRMAKYADDKVIKFVLATFVGIMVYNCFETTLLQNKTFLGVIQWFAIVLGLLRCRYLQSKERLE